MRDTRIGISLIGESAISSRIHERLPAHQFRVRAYSGARSILRRSRLIEEFVPVGTGRRSSISDLVTGVEQGTIHHDDWLVWGTDEALEAVRKSDIPIEAKLTLLPTKTEVGLSILGSKVGLVELCNRFGIVQPRSAVANSVDELVTLPSEPKNFLIKGDSGSSGSRVKRFSLRDRDGLSAVPPDWFPVVVQEFVNGPMISVEALFRNGKLSHYLYSEAREFTQTFGLSRVRHFRQPFSTDFIDMLQHLGELAGLHGFANCSFIWEEDTARHLLIEADIRPNRWHQYGPDLGVEWAAGLRGIASPTRLSPHPHHEAVIHHFPREIVEGIRSKKWSWLTPWLKNQPGTWQWRQQLDSAVNWQDWRSIARAIVVGLLPKLKK